MILPMTMKVSLIGYDSGWGCLDYGCSDGPDAIGFDVLCSMLGELGVEARSQGILNLKRLGNRADFHDKAATLSYVIESRARLMAAVNTAIQDGFIPLVIGGDHFSAAGTWAAVTQAKGCARNFHLFWVDAHLDAHTMKTAHEGKWGGWWHGMPVACLMGEGEKGLSDGPVLSPEHFHIMGVRSYEPGERAFLESRDVDIHYIEKVRDKGFASVWNAAFGKARRDGLCFGLSLDLDAFDPAYAPGVGSGEENGLRPDDVLPSLKGLAYQPGFLGAEIVELNPHNDVDGKTAALARDVVMALFQRD